MSLQKWKELVEKRRLVEQYYKEKDKPIKEYKFRRGVSSDFYERVAKPVTDKIREQIKKKQEEQAEKITEKIGDQIEQMQGLPLPGPQIHPLPVPEKKPTGYIADPDKGIDYHWIPDKYKQVSELVAIKNDAERHNKLRLARDRAATEVINYGNKARGVKKLRRKKRVIVT